MNWLAATVRRQSIGLGAAPWVELVIEEAAWQPHQLRHNPRTMADRRAGDFRSLVTVEGCTAVLNPCP